MNQGKFLFIALFIGFKAMLLAQPHHLYVEWHHKDSMVELGTYYGKKFKQMPKVVVPIRQLTPETIDLWLGNTVSDSNVLLYFHSMWGQEIHFHRRCLRGFEKITAGASQTIISFVWHAGGLRYNRNWACAADKGEPLGPLIDRITQVYGDRIDVLCHSMGNRLFEGTLRTIAPENHKEGLFQSVILFSADLDTPVEDADFELLRKTSGDIAVFVHCRDRILLLSSWLHGRNRLGRSGPSGNIPADITVFDMTKHARNIQNHTHLNKGWVQDQMKTVLTARFKNGFSNSNKVKTANR